MTKKKTKKRVVITGSGVASALGNEFETYCQHLFEGRYGIAPITTFDTSNYKTKIAGALDPLPLPESLTPLKLKTVSKLTQISLHCVEQALEQAGLNLEAVDSEQIGVIVGSGHLNIYDLEIQFERFFRDGHNFSPRTVPVCMASSTPSQIAINFGINGIVKTVSTACASGFSAIVDGVRAIQDGHQEVVIAGGADLVVCRTVLNAWEQMRVIAAAGEEPALACRPFHQQRDGVALGDGAAYFVLESYDNALARGANILAEISGFCHNSDSVNIVAPQTEKEIACIEQALQMAELVPDEIDMIFAHATGTYLNDKIEVESLGTLFGERLSEIPMCGLKSMLGHTMGASGPMSLMAALGSLQNGAFYPIPNLDAVDETLDICTTTEGKTLEGVDHILLNAFAFGGVNVCLVVSGTVTT